MMDGAPPLILTAAFDALSFRHFDAMRRRHFPPERNLIPAHLTLFHELPGDEEDAIRATLREVSTGQEPIALPVTGLRSLGYGSAYVVTSPVLDRLRATLATGWAAWLTPQDAQRFAAHVTIQNKVPARQAKALCDELDATFEPFAALATGLILWRYLGGPWDKVAEFPFAASA